MRDKDLETVNRANMEAFRELERREHLYNLGSLLRPVDLWRMYLASRPEGCFVLESQGRIAGYCFCHLWGTVGWFGPLGVLPEYQRMGFGKELVLVATDYLVDSGATVVGLETIPGSPSNLGFYAKLGFTPGPMSLVMTALPQPLLRIQPAGLGHAVVSYHAAPAEEQQRLLLAASQLTQRLHPGLDYTEEVTRTQACEFGTTLFLTANDRLAGMAVCHTKPYFYEERAKVLRVKLLWAGELETRAVFDHLLYAIGNLAAALRLDQVQVAGSTRHWQWMLHLLQRGFQVTHTGVRMTFPGYEETVPADRLDLNRWVG